MGTSNNQVLLFSIIWQISMAGCPVLADNASFEQAIDMQKSGQYESAIAKYRELLRSKPDDDRIWYSMGTAYQAKGDLKRAADAYKKAIALNPNCSNYKKVLSDVQDVQISKFIEEAEGKRESGNANDKIDLSRRINYYREALRIKPDTGLAKTVWFRLGRAYQAAGQLMEAREAFEHAIDLDPANSSFRKALQEVGGPTGPEQLPPSQRWGDFGKP